jgi:hypothetical protein
MCEAAGRTRNPDGFAVCSPAPNTSTVVTGTIVVLEILSESTSSTGRIEKHAEYRATPSIQRYVILEPDIIAATVFGRAGSDWTGHFFLDGAILAMPEIGIDVPLAEFHDGLVFDEQDEAKDCAPRTGQTQERAAAAAPLIPSREAVPAREASSPPGCWQRQGRQSQLPKPVANETNKAGIATNPLRAAGGRSANFDLPGHFDDIILGHEIVLLRKRRGVAATVQRNRYSSPFTKFRATLLH